MRTSKILVITVLFVVLSGCGRSLPTPATLDASTKENFSQSIEKIKGELPEQKREEFISAYTKLMSHYTLLGVFEKKIASVPDLQMYAMRQVDKFDANKVIEQ